MTLRSTALLLCLACFNPTALLAESNSEDTASASRWSSFKRGAREKLAVVVDKSAAAAKVALPYVRKIPVVGIPFQSTWRKMLRMGVRDSVMLVSMGLAHELWPSCGMATRGKRYWRLVWSGAVAMSAGHAVALLVDMGVKKALKSRDKKD